MPAICLYFQVHQPFRVKKYAHFGIGRDHDYFNDEAPSSLNNRFILERVARKCYLPANRLMLELLTRHPEFRLAYSFSGVALEQFERFAPDVLDSFRDLVATGRVEILAETFHHSLSFLYSRDEFRRQVAMHTAKVERLFGVTPQVFRNTELIYSNEVAAEAERLGFKAVLAEGAERLLGWRSPDFVYRPAGCGKIALLLKNYRLSDDIAFRFSSRQWNDWPLTAEKFAKWVGEINGNGTNVNLFMDYETVGEHQWEDTGIFDFLRAMPAEILKHPDNTFATPSEIAERFAPVGAIDAPDYVSWADIERDLTAWRGNRLQQDALHTVYSLERPVLESGNAAVIDDWRRLQTSDHFYYMCTKWFADGDVHAYFNPYESPYDAFVSYMNVVEDLRLRVQAAPTA
ncbi:MAG: glycoside hydrolase family 57 protein [Patescibacteria group bacterium]|nr:glycoside hydrolase family 57 protein [Patescibacteria group bacterium]